MIRGHELLWVILNYVAIFYPRIELTVLIASLIAFHFHYRKSTRFQLWPSIIVSVVTAIWAIKPQLIEEQVSFYIASQTFNVIMQSTSVLLQIIMPAYESVVQPSGPYRVGMRIHSVEQTEDQLKQEEAAYADHLKRTEFSTASKEAQAHVRSRHNPFSFLDEKLKLNIRIYYPSDPDTPIDRVPYFYHGAETTKGFARFVNMPFFIFHHLNLLRIRLITTPKLATKFLGSANPATNMAACPFSAIFKDKDPATLEKLKAQFHGHGVPTHAPPVPSAASSSSSSAAVAPTPDPSTVPADPNIKFPVVIYSHGLGGTVDIYQSTILELASQGYIVVCPEHNDHSASFTKLDEQVSLYRSLAELREAPPANAKVAMAASVTAADSKKKDQQKSPTPSPKDSVLSEERTDYEVRNLQLHHRAREVRFCLEYLDSLAGSDPMLKGHVDATRVAVIGHSFGGATITQAAFEDNGSRIGAAINLDGWQLPFAKSEVTHRSEVVEHGLQAVPLLLIQSTAFQIWKSNYDSMLKMFSRSHPQSVYLTLTQSGHHNFSDFAIFAPLVMRAMKLIGKRNPTKQLKVLNKYIVAYLQRQDIYIQPSASYRPFAPVQTPHHPLFDDTSARTDDFEWETRLTQ